jgi:hypothetical protein
MSSLRPRLRYFAISAYLIGVSRKMSAERAIGMLTCLLSPQQRVWAAKSCVLQDLDAAGELILHLRPELSEGIARASTRSKAKRPPCWSNAAEVGNGI